MPNNKEPAPLRAGKRADEVAGVDIDPATGSVSVRASDGLRGFFAQVIGAPLTELVGMGTDTLKHRRLMRSLQHIAEAHRQVEQAGLTAKIRQLPDAVTVPLIDAASLEDDENLRAMFAGLLANAATSTGRTDSYIRFSKIARDMTPLEALCLVKIGDACIGVDKLYGGSQGVVTMDLPDKVHLGYSTNENGVRNPDTDAAIHALVGQGLLRESVDGIEAVWITSLGRSFLDACQPPT